MSQPEQPQVTETASQPLQQEQNAQTKVVNESSKLDKIESAEKGLNIKFIELIYNTGVNKDKNLDSFPVFNGKDKIKISIFFVNKYLYSQNKSVVFNWTEEDEKRNIIEVLYEKDVEELMLEDALDEISLKGSFILRCEGSRFQGVLENYMQFDLVIGFTLCDEKNNCTYLEPYIFNITNIKQLSRPNDQNKKYLISFLDILSYVASNHSFASVRKLAQGSLSNAKNYETLFNTIYDYLVSFMQRFTLGSFTYDKINFIENSDIDTSELVKMTIDKIPQSANVLDALKIISYDACTAINMKKEKLEEVKKDFELFEGDATALVPLFFKEEYLLHSGIYEAVFDNESHQTLRSKLMQLENNSSNSKNILLRSIFKRNLSMPFYFAFDKDKIIFESLNPEPPVKEKNTSNTEITSTADTEESFSCISGQKISPITSMTTNFIDMTINNTRWKNMIFLYESQSKGDGNFLLRFDWIFNLYNRVFLNQSVNKNIVTSILPDFYINEKIGFANGSIITEEEKKKREEAKAKIDAKIAPSRSESPNGNVPTQNSTQSSTLDDDEQNKETKIALSEKDYHEYNANTYLIRSEDSTKEAQYHVGKMITSFIMLNTAYSYNIEGSLFRRPNEIVKINRHINNFASHDPNPNAPSGLKGQSKYTMVYVTNVKHFFKGKSFINVVAANKIYDTYA